MSREFFTTNPTDGKLVKLVEGVIGFVEVDHLDQATADKLNQLNGNTERDLEIAIGASMFGWDTPLAGMISNGQCAAK